MRYLTFTQPERDTGYPIALLVPVLRKDEIQKAYLEPHGINPDEVVAIELSYSQLKKKTPKAELVQYIEEMLVPAFETAGVEYVVVADAEYFKALTGVTKVDVNLGYVLNSEYGSWKVIYVPNFRQIFYDPDRTLAKIKQGFDALKSYRGGHYDLPGVDIIHFEAYPTTPAEIKVWLDKLILENRPLSADIEAFSLKHDTAGIGTITLCWSKHEGIAFPVDLGPEPSVVRDLLIDFFIRFRERIMWHNISYDVYVLIYQLFMRNLIDTDGLLEGMQILLNNWDDTKLIAYLATNSCAGNKLGLKDQAQEFAGNYANEDIKDIRKIPLAELLRYNLIDGLSTWYVYEKHWPTLIADQQLPTYVDVFKPAILDIIQMQLTGMPLNMERVKEVKALLEKDQNKALKTIHGSPLIGRFEYQLEERHVHKRNAALKKKQIAIGDEPQEFNPNSAPQLQSLLYEMLALPIIAKTDTGLPATDGDTLKALLNHTTDPLVIDFLKAMMDYNAVNKILTSFIPAMEAAPQGPDGWHYLFGNFNLGGTISGRLSSSNPNLQNLPANSKYAKLIKSCFQAPPGWVFAGLDFASLEDRISALTTKDPNKIKVYTDGYDGHSLRAYSYFSDQMPDIDPNSVESINSIQDKYKPLRQDSKTPTFLLTYAGTYMGIIEQCGFSTEKAKLIEARYHEMYIVSDQWVAEKLDQAAKDGFVTAAFGLRVRTPLLKQVIRGNSRTPYEAAAEGRSAGNALGQSWCLLNSRAGSEFMGKVRQSEYRLDIRPCAQIHDAGYFLIRDTLETILYTNEHLVKAVQWQNHPDIWHDEVKLGGELSVFYPDWGTEVVIPNGATADEVLNLVRKHREKLEAA